MPTSTGSNTVQLVINVVDANSGEVISRVTKNVEALGSSGARAGKQGADGLTSLGEAGARATKRVSDGFQEMGGHSLTALDNVRLLRDDLGIRIPRAMENVIARSTVMSGAIAAAGSAFVTLGAAELLYHVGEQVYQLYEKWIDTTKAVKDYEIEAGKAAQQQLFSSAPFDTQIRLARQAQAEVDALQAKKRASDNTPFIDQLLLPHSSAPRYNTDDSTRLADAMGRTDQTQMTLLEQTHKLSLQNIDDIERRAKASATAAGAITVEAHAAHQRNIENRDYARQVDQIEVEAINRAHRADPKKNPFVAQANPDAGQQEYGAAEQSAAATAAAAGTQLAIEQQKTLMDLRHQATQAGLEGERLLTAQRGAALEDLAAKYRFAHQQNAQWRAEEAAINDRFDKIERQHIDEQTEALRKRNAEAAQKGLTGLAAIDARTAAENATVQSDLDHHRFYGDKQQQQEFGSGLQAANSAAGAQEATKAQQGFTDRIQQMDDTRANSSMTANERIAAETRRTVAEITKAWQDLYGQLALNDARRVQGQALLNAEVAKINTSAAEEMARNNRQIADETRKLQLEAGRGGGGNVFAQRSREIQADAEDRTRQIQEREDAAYRAGELDNVRQFEAQKLAIQQIANNRELDLVREQRDKLAGELRGFFTNPLEALKRQGADLASKAAADLLMGRRPGADGTGNGIAAVLGGGGFGNLRNVVRPTFQRNAGMPAGRGEYEAGAPVPAASQSATVNAATATITISNASINGGGFNAAASPSAAVGSIAAGGYAPIGNGSFFNLGSSGPGAAAATSAGPFARLDASGFGSAATSGTGSTGFGDSVTSAYSNIQGGFSQANSLGKDLGIFGKDANGNNAGLASKIPGLKNMSPETLGKLGGVAGGAMTVFSAFEGKGGFGGAAQGALGGAQAGMQYGGLAGAALGAVIGGVLGFMGHGARVQAQKYYWKELRPKVEAEMLGFQAGTADYQSVYDDLTTSDREAKQKTREMGSGAVGYYNDTIHPDLQKYQQRLTREAKAGRQQFGMSAAQFHLGGRISTFGSMATSSDEGWFHGKLGETVLNQQATMSHGDVAALMNAGTSRADIAEYLVGGNAPQRQAVSGGGPVELHFHSHDARGAYQLFMDNKHTIREALNSSYAENSGGAD